MKKKYYKLSLNKFNIIFTQFYIKKFFKIYFDLFTFYQ